MLIVFLDEDTRKKKLSATENEFFKQNVVYSLDKDYFQ